tara:strand:- start:95925 stop:97028 length:1104 start_codon:yes stop_codon:yes gene_type:complete
LAITLLCIACLTIMVGCVIVPGLPLIAPQLGVSNAAGWLVTVPSLGVVLFGPLVARVIDRLGLYASLITGLLAYGLLGAAGAWLQGPWLIFADRLLLGAATVLVMASGTGLISVFYQGRARLNMMAKQGMAIEAGGVIMLAAGGFLAGISWYLPFSLYLIAWFFILPVIAFVPRPPADIRTADVHADKTIPLSLKLVYFAAMMSLIVFFSAVILLPFKLQQLHFSSAETGYFLSFLSFVAVIAAALMPKASRTLGEYQTLILAFGLYTIGQTIFNFSDSLFTLIAGACFTGFGFGFSVPLVNHMTVEQSHPQHRGRMLAYLSMAVFSGQFLSSFMEMLPCGLGLVAAAYLAALSGVFIFMSHRAIRK